MFPYWQNSSQWSTFFCTIKIALHFIQLSGKCYVKWLTNRKGIEKQFFSIKSMYFPLQKAKKMYTYDKNTRTRVCTVSVHLSNPISNGKRCHWKIVAHRQSVLDAVQDFLIKLGIKPCMHLWKISISTLNT